MPKMTQEETNKTSFIIFLFVISFTSLLLSFPSLSKLAVFAKGEFTYTESLGAILGYLALLLTSLFWGISKLGNVKFANKLSRYLILFGITGLSLLFTLFMISRSWIGFEVKNQCVQATREYGGGCVGALVKVLDDENNKYRQRNSVIWALGQLGDKQALPILQKYCTGQIPDREPLDTTISQYELKKAIALVKGGTNISAFVWRWMIVK